MSHRLLLGAALGCAVPLPLFGQHASARVLVGGGTATDLRGTRSGAYLLVPSVTLSPNPNLALNVLGRATRFSNGAWSLGGAAAAAVRVPLGAGLGVLLNGSGDLTRASYGATYRLAEAQPALEWRAGAFSVWGGVHAAAARTSFESSPGPGLPLSGALTRSLAGPAFGAGVRLVTLRGAAVTLAYREEHSRPSGVPLTDRLAAAGWSHGPLALSGTFGIRRAEDERRTFGGARLAVTLVPGVDLVGSAESYPGNRLTGTPGGRSLTAGISLGIGGPHTPARLPAPAGAPALPHGMTRLSLAAPAAERVEVAGDWNRWRPEPLTRSSNGVWYADLVIPPGTYRYAFRVDGKTWQVPKGVAAVDDGFGGKSAWLSVAESGRTAIQSANR